MIITCPACQTRYKVEPGQLGPKGRRVRCTGCNHIWTEPPAEDLPKVLEPEAPAGEMLEPGGAPQGADPARRRGRALGWAALAATVVLLAVGGALGRDAIIDAWPPAERLYMAVGYAAPTPGEGLSVRVIEHGSALADGGTVLVIKGEISNVSEVVRKVPPLRASLWSGEAEELVHWSFSAAKERLLPGENAEFVTRYENPPESADGVRVDFSGKRR